MTQVGTGCQLDPGLRRDDARQNAGAFCHPEGVFTPLPSAKNVKTTVRIQFVYVSALGYSPSLWKKGGTVVDGGVIVKCSNIWCGWGGIPAPASHCTLCMLCDPSARVGLKLQKSIRVKIAKARAHWDNPQFYPLQENQGFFATHFFTKMKKFFGGFPPLFNFANCPEIVAKKPWFFYDVHE